MKVLFNVSWNSSIIKRVRSYVGLYYCSSNCPGYDPTDFPRGCPFCK
jgi:hypothetical protein